VFFQRYLVEDTLCTRDHRDTGRGRKPSSARA